MECAHVARRVGTEHGNRHWEYGGGNGAWMVGTGHAWKVGLKGEAGIEVSNGH